MIMCHVASSARLEVSTSIHGKAQPLRLADLKRKYRSWLVAQHINLVCRMILALRQSHSAGVFG
jgi:hypothetical protein